MDVLIPGILVVFVLVPAFGSVRFAARSAPNGRHARMLRAPLRRGSALSAFNLVVLVCVAWWTHEDQHYDDFAAGTTILLAVTSASVLLLGLGPLISWLLGVLVQRAVRLPPLMRLAVRDLADNRARSAAVVTTTMVLTAMAVIVTIVATATTAQERVRYFPQGRPGALLVEVSSAEDVAVVHAAVQRELPGVPMVRSLRAGAWHFIPDVENLELPDFEAVTPVGVFGEGELLHYLTGDPATPYDENTAVVVTSDDVKADTVTISYGPLEGADALSSRNVPAIVVRPTDPEVKELFVPAKVIRDLGYQPQLDKLIIDPSAHRTSRAEQERIDRRLGDTATTYVERGFEPSTGWRPIVAVAVVLALGAALFVGRGGPRTTRVLPRLGGGSPRLFAACRVGIGTACGTAVGTVTGCVVGLLLAWPFTAPIEWEPIPRVSFETPWLLIAALPLVLSLLAALIAALAPVPSKEGPSGRRLFGNRNVTAG
ncbi:hypothetical protein ABZ470_10425 [Streptosporangium sp. NPDC020072]|uniref:hypothetical protein n=1 Tax=Streptosporangium sp. NPDC020072 TaxID=3154788 RepID=UPI00342F1DD8